MKIKGFTLVELLAVIVILAVILAIAIPGISGIIKSSIMSSMESDAKLLLRSIELKKLEDSSFDPESYNGNMEDLLTALSLSSVNYENILFTNHNGELYVEVIGKGKWDGFSACGSYKNMTVSEGTCEIDFIAPVITLNGDISIEVDRGTTFTDTGATATDNIAGDVTSKITTTGTVDINTIGTYTITYTVSDSSGNITTTTRTINVVAPNYAGPSYKASKGVNGPVLAGGMVPIKWDGST
jgi:prepilin-type N-terminal cleavage/methylation domain-containing protein